MRNAEFGIGSGGVLKPEARSLKPVQRVTNHESRTTNQKSRRFRCQADEPQRPIFVRPPFGREVDRKLELRTED